MTFPHTNPYIGCVRWGFSVQFANHMRLVGVC